MFKRQYRNKQKRITNTLEINRKQDFLINKAIFYFYSPILSVLFIGLFGGIFGFLAFYAHEAVENIYVSEIISIVIISLINFLIFGSLGYFIHKIILRGETMQENIITDPLTKIRSRSYLLGKEDCLEDSDCSVCLLDCRLVKEIIRSNRYKKPFSFFIMDVDNFKRINDQYGHIVGDIALKYIADKIKESVRVGIDIVGRLSGDEFYVLLPENSQENSITIAERIRSMVDSTPLILDGDLHIIKSEDAVKKMIAKHVISLSLSIGVAHFEYFNPISNLIDAKKEILKSADVALYQSKLKGRNLVSVSPVII